MIKTIFTVLILAFIYVLPAESQGTTYNILNFGAKNDKKVISTQAIQKAIDACSQEGGGTVVVPAGEYLSGTIVLKSNINFHLEPGAVIYASRDKKDYGHLTVEVGAADLDRSEVLLLAENCTNISITGQGELNGQAVREQYQRKAEFDPNEMITGREIANAAKYGVDYRTKYRKVAPYTALIFLVQCSDVHISGIKVVESSFWSVHLQWCEKAFIHDIQVYSNRENGVNADGLDVDGCNDVLISDCIINTGDDALCIKTTRTRNKSMPCENITINNCILSSSSSAFKIGTESHSDFNNISVSNCIIKDANRGLGIILRDGGSVKNVRFSDITINTVRKKCFWWGNGDPIWLIVYKRNNNVTSGTIEDISFTNVYAHGQSGIRLEGIDNTLRNITFNNVRIFMDHEHAVDKRSEHAFSAYNIKEMELHNCSVRWNETDPEKAWGKAFQFNEIEDLSISGLKGKQAPLSESGAITLNNIQNAIIKDCLAPVNTGTFIVISGKKTRNILDYGNFTGNSAQGWSISGDVDAQEVIHVNKQEK